MKFLTCLAMVLGLSLFSFSQISATDQDKESNTMPKSTKQHPVVLLKTSAGDIKIELYPEKAPITVKNFLQYVNEGFYTNTIFHRVIKGFMVQGGGFTKEMKQKAGHAPIANEAENGLKNDRGTIAMARTSDINSASSQFFINAVDNAFLNFTDKTSRGYGYCVFGKVTEGMDIIDKILQAKTSTQGGHGDVPVEAIVLLEAKEI